MTDRPFGGRAPARPLAGVRVLDFSTLLPGPLATLLLAEAGAEVVKVERPGTGDEMRSYRPRFAGASANFALLNRGKRAVAADLKDPASAESIRRLAEGADVLVEQFRPGVMDRLGLGYRQLRERNPRLVYCSITGYGQDGPHAAKAGHDLNYVAEVGLLDVVRDATGAPSLPPALLADIAGGAYPAMMNIVLALVARDRSGRGTHLDVSMADNLRPFLYWALAEHASTGRWPAAGTGLIAGGSPRYRIYRTADGRYLAVAALEDRFWERFCELVGVPIELRDDEQDPDRTAAAVAERIGARTAAHWDAVLGQVDACCSVVRTLDEAAAAFDDTGTPHRVRDERFDVPALPVPIAAAFRGDGGPLGYPGLGQDNDLLSRDDDRRRNGA